jgi:hypothetical protein
MQATAGFPLSFMPQMALTAMLLSAWSFFAV